MYEKKTLAKPIFRQEIHKIDLEKKINIYEIQFRIMRQTVNLNIDITFVNPWKTSKNLDETSIQTQNTKQSFVLGIP